MSAYAHIIAEGLGIDETEACVVEQVLRVEHPTLDHLTRADLVRGAREAQEVLAYFRAEEPDIAESYERQAQPDLALCQKRTAAR